ncbi:MAG: hypothetical protein WCI05_06215 [Myxococcales bacterium]|jgi:hypothetical protein
MKRHWGIGAALLLGLSCVIADPPAELPRPPRRRPTIFHGSVVPPLGQVLGQFPTQFVVPVDVGDPSTSFEWNVFLDYDPVSRPAPVLSGFEEDPAGMDAGVRVVAFSIDVPDPTACHVIEFMVALTFNRASAHTPDSYGADSTIWLYNPSGLATECPRYDAGGLDGAFPNDR